MLEFFLKTAYYGAMFASAALVSFFFLGNLFKPGPGSSGVETSILIVAGLASYSVLGFSAYSGHWQGAYGLGLGGAVLALVLFGVIMLGGTLLFGKVHWQ